MMRQTVGDRSPRDTRVYNRGQALELMVASAVEEVADTHNAGGFPDEIQGQRRGAAGK